MDPFEYDDEEFHDQIEYIPSSMLVEEEQSNVNSSHEFRDDALQSAISDISALSDTNRNTRRKFDLSLLNDSVCTSSPTNDTLPFASEASQNFKNHEVPKHSKPIKSQVIEANDTFTTAVIPATHANKQSGLSSLFQFASSARSKSIKPFAAQTRRKHQTKRKGVTATSKESKPKSAITKIYAPINERGSEPSKTSGVGVSSVFNGFHSPAATSTSFIGKHIAKGKPLSRVVDMWKKSLRKHTNAINLQAHVRATTNLRQAPMPFPGQRTTHWRLEVVRVESVGSFTIVHGIVDEKNLRIALHKCAAGYANPNVAKLNEADTATVMVISREVIAHDARDICISSPWYLSFSLGQSDCACDADDAEVFVFASCISQDFPTSSSPI